jgi:uncharacterized membrane protein
MEDVNPNAVVTTAAATDPAQGKEAAWVAYILHAFGYVTAMMWPAIIGVVVNYYKRDDARGGAVDSHHDWMIRTFWYGLLWYLLSLAVLLGSAWPIVLSVWRGAMSGEYVFAWSAIFQTVSVATLGALGFLATWIWLLYRVIRGMVRLAESRAVP